MKRFLAALLALTLSMSMAAQSTKPKQDAPKTHLKVGDLAPDFTLKDQNGNDVRLSDFRGKKNVAIAFVVFAFTGG